MISGQCPRCEQGIMYFCGSFYRCVRCDHQLDTMVTTVRELRQKDTWTYSGFHVPKVQPKKLEKTVVQVAISNVEQLRLF